jgi:hypothetical protein
MTNPPSVLPPSVKHQRASVTVYPTAEEFPAITQLRLHAKLGGPTLLDRVLTEFFQLLQERETPQPPARLSRTEALL